VAVIKKKLSNVFDALGQPPAGYAKERESFNLPTEASKNRDTGRYYLIGASATRDFGTEKSAESAGKDLSKEYEKKILEAQAKGDYEAIGKLSQEMQQKAGKIQLDAVESRKEPIHVNVNFNASSGATIDPDMVVFEKPGVIALRTVNELKSGNEYLHVYFDPVSLKNTKQLSRVDLKQPEGGISKRTGVLSATIQLSGPTSEIEPWAKRIDAGKVLAQIDGAK